VESQPDAECLKDAQIDMAGRQSPFERVVAHHLLDTVPASTAVPVVEAEEVLMKDEKTIEIVLAPTPHATMTAPEILWEACNSPAKGPRGGRGQPGQSGQGRFGIVIDQLGCKNPPLHGLGLDPTDGTALLVDAIGEGMVREWNRKALQHSQVCHGDRIVEVSGAYGDANALRSRLNDAVCLTLILLRPRWFNVQLSKAKESLGLEMAVADGCATILVKKVLSGSIMEWNQQHQDLQVTAGDRIAEVNGVRGDGSALRDTLLKQDNVELRILVAHVPLPVGCYSQQC
jgi:hypothetical protein